MPSPKKSSGKSKRKSLRPARPDSNRGIWRRTWGALFSRPDVLAVYLAAARKHWIPAVVIDLTPERIAQFREAGVPAVESEGLKQLTDDWQQRVWDGRILADAKVQEFLKAEGIVLTDWKEMMRRFDGGAKPDGKAPGSETPRSEKPRSAAGDSNNGDSNTDDAKE